MRGISVKNFLLKLKAQVWAYMLVHPGSVLLLVLISIICIATVQPMYELAGWDNFSVSLNPWLNLKRTLFITWRDYRGLGVPSDSEITDIFRQVVFAFLDIFLPQQFLGQLYVFICLFIGVITTYFLFKKILANHISTNRVGIEIGATTAALFYLFNLNTLATFYHPMTMFVTRFALFPTLLLAYFHFINTSNKKAGVKGLLVMCVVALLGAASYLTATVFITLGILLFLIFSLYENRKKQLIVLCVFGLINMFWLLPFANYTKEKASLIPISSTFVEVNEIQLNKSPSVYSWFSILTMQPDFISAKPTSLSDGSLLDLHEFIDEFETDQVYRTFLLLLPGLYFVGILSVLSKREKRLFWAVGLVALLIITSRKFHPPFGFLYATVNDKMPLIDIIFRFPDTKFYPLIALAGAILAGYALSQTQNLFRYKKFTAILLSTTFIVTCAFFISYFKGFFINPLMYSKIPHEYYKIADSLNKSEDDLRVVHLPNESISYWKPYSWGYIGSTFLTFILDKPLMERTFEPASLENDYFNQAIFEISKTSHSASEELLLSKTQKLNDLMQKTHTGYILWDGSVTPNVYSRGKRYWGNFPTDDMKTLIEGMETNQFTNKQTQELIDLEKYFNIYRDSTELAPVVKARVTENRYAPLSLYKLNTVPKMFNSIESTINTGMVHKNLALEPLLGNGLNYTQIDGESSLIAPFLAPNIILNTSDNLSLELPSWDYARENLSLGTLPNNDSLSNQETAVTVYSRIENNDVVLGIKEYELFKSNVDASSDTIIEVARVSRPLTMPLAKEKTYLADWWTYGVELDDNIRITVDETVIPLPNVLTAEYKEVATVLVKTQPFTLKVFTKGVSTPLVLSDFSYTDNANCFKDLYSAEEYTSTLNKENQTIKLNTANGSSCITSFLGIDPEIDSTEKLIDLDIDYTALVTNVGTPINEFHKDTTAFQKSVRGFVDTLNTETFLDICIVNKDTTGCLNNHRTTTLKDTAILTVPQTFLTQLQSPQILLSAVTVGQQGIELELKGVILNTYEKANETTIDLSLYRNTENVLNIERTAEGSMQLELPKILSRYSYYFNPQTDALLSFNRPCPESDQYRTTRRLGDDVVIYLENCDHGVSVSQTFDPKGFYLWYTSYNVLSGKYPKFKLENSDLVYKNEYLSINQGYPNLDEFKNVQSFVPLSLFPRANQESAKRLIETSPFVTTYTYVYPHISTLADGQVLYTISQNSENQGLVKFDDMNIVRLPNTWVGTYIQNGEVTRKYDKLTINSYKKVLPSLWKVEVQKDTTSEGTGRYLLEFGQGFDNQWGIYNKSSLGAFLGLGDIDAKQARINGFTNGWVINNSDLSTNGTTTYYVFYTPERLAIFGWSITVLTLGTLLALVLRMRIKKHHDY